MKKITRLTESDLRMMVENSVSKVLRESVDYDREIRFAQKELYKISSNLSSIGMRLEGTQFRDQYKRIYSEIAKLNSALISYINGGRK